MAEKPLNFLEEIPFVYGRFRNLMRNKPLPVHIFGTGSSGNSLFLKNLKVLIDLGLPYSKFSSYDKEFFSKVDYIILTHEHGDHFNPATFVKVLKCFPHVKFIMSKRMARTIVSEQASKLIKQKQKEFTPYVINQTQRFLQAEERLLTNRNGKSFSFKPHHTSHGSITNLAVELTCNELNLHLLYASDLDCLEQKEVNRPVSNHYNFFHVNTTFTTGLPKYESNPFNIIFLEANYDEEILFEHLRMYPDDIRAKGNLRHISEQTAFEYVEHYLSDDGFFIPLHGSKEFGTLIQNFD